MPRRTRVEREKPRRPTHRFCMTCQALITGKDAITHDFLLCDRCSGRDAVNAKLAPPWPVPARRPAPVQGDLFA
jgi:hypothetical protein